MQGVFRQRAAPVPQQAETVRIISAYKATGRVPNVVNLATHTPATHTLVVRRRDKPGVLARIAGVLGEAYSLPLTPERFGFEFAKDIFN